MIRIESTALTALPGLAHGFFGHGAMSPAQIAERSQLGQKAQRHSETPGSSALMAEVDAALDKERDLDRIAKALDVPVGHLMNLQQVHGPRAIHAVAPWGMDLPEADGLVTAVPGLALVIQTADCAPVLLADAEAGLIGAFHAGWRGAAAGIADRTIAEMLGQGAELGRMTAAIGPMIRQRNYQVGRDMRDAFLAEAPDGERFFAGDPEPGKYRFDLPGFLTKTLTDIGIGHVEDCGICTYAQEAEFASYRRATRQGTAKGARNLSAIVLR